MTTTTEVVQLTTNNTNEQAEKKGFATQDLSPRKCYRPVIACVRCGCRIEAGQMMEPWIDGPRAGTRYNWVHEGCAPVAGFAPEAPKAKQQEELPKLKEHTHEVFEEVLLLAKQRMNIMLPGPAGCGKTHLAAQVAKALGLRFASISCSAGMSEGQLTGKLLPVGENGQFNFVTTDYLECFEHGGVFLFDELDAADANVLLVINSALANGMLSLPNRSGNTRAVRHPDFVCIAATNTFGRGCDRMYVGRAQLDEATLDRFRIGTVEMDYDTKVEKRLCPDNDLRSMLETYRKGVRNHRLQRVVSSRFMRDAYSMKLAGWDHSRIEKALFGGWSEDEVRKIKS